MPLLYLENKLLNLTATDTFTLVSVNTFFLPMRWNCSIFSGAGKFFFAYRMRISACFTWTDNSYLTHVISPKTG